MHLHPYTRSVGFGQHMDPFIHPYIRSEVGLLTGPDPVLVAAERGVDHLVGVARLVDGREEAGCGWMEIRTYMW